MDEYHGLIEPNCMHGHTFDSQADLVAEARRQGVPEPYVIAAVGAQRPRLQFRGYGWRGSNYTLELFTGSRLEGDRTHYNVTNLVDDAFSEDPELSVLNRNPCRLVRLTAEERRKLQRRMLSQIVGNRYPERQTLTSIAYEDPRVARRRSPTVNEARQVLAERVRETVKGLRAGEIGRDLSEIAFDSVDDDYNLLGALYCMQECVGYSSERLTRINSALRRAGAGWDIRRLHCGHFGLAHACVRTNDGLVCQDCRDEYYVETVEGDIVHQDNAYTWDRDGEYHTEEEPEDDYYDDGDDDSGGDTADRLMDYSTDVMRHLTVDPSFVTSPTGDFHMGVELETILTSGGVDSKVYEVRQELGEDYLVAKYDGSLGDPAVPGRGIEWVTRPTSLAVHIEKFGDWKYTVNSLVAWDAKCCGMHVHIDARAFTAASLGKLLQFFNRPENSDFIRRIAGRHPDRDRQAESYAARDIPTCATVDPLKALKGKGINRYTMVNLQNLRRSTAIAFKLPDPDNYNYNAANTVEIRIFRASMRKERLLSQLEFTHALVRFCRQAGYRSVDSSDFVAWLAHHTGEYQHLSRFLGVAPHKHGKVRGNTTHSARADETAVDAALEPRIPDPPVSTLDLTMPVPEPAPEYALSPELAAAIDELASLASWPHAPVAA